METGMQKMAATSVMKKKPAVQMPKMPDSASVEKRITGLMSSDNPLLKRSKTLAMQSSAARGLQSSSIAEGAGVTAMLDKAQSIASQDAAQEYDLHRTGVNNQFAAGQNQLNRDHEATLQSKDQSFQTSENAKDRAFQADIENLRHQNQLGVITAEGRERLTQLEAQSAQTLKLQNDSQAFQAEQAELDRATTKELEELRNKNQLGLLNAEGEQRLRELTQQQNFQREESNQNRAFESYQNSQDRELTKEIESLRIQAQKGILDQEGQQRLKELEVQQKFQKDQATQDRALTRELESLRYKNQLGLLDAEGKQRLEELSRQQDFENKTQDKQLGFQKDQATQDRALTRELESLRYKNQLGLLNAEGKQRLEELSRQQNFDYKMQDKQFGFQKDQADLDRDLTREIESLKYKQSLGLLDKESELRLQELSRQQNFQYKMQANEIKASKELEKLRSDNQLGLLTQEGRQRLKELEKQQSFQKSQASIDRDYQMKVNKFQAKTSKELEQLRADNQSGLLSQEGTQRLAELEQQSQNVIQQQNQQFRLQSQRDQLLQSYQQQNMNLESFNRLTEIEGQVRGQLATIGYQQNFERQMQYTNQVANAVNNAMASLGNAMLNETMTPDSFQQYQSNVEAMLQTRINEFNIMYGFDGSTIPGNSIPDVNIPPPDIGTPPPNQAPPTSGGGGQNPNPSPNPTPGPDSPIQPPPITIPGNPDLPIHPYRDEQIEEINRKEKVGLMGPIKVKDKSNTQPTVNTKAKKTISLYGGEYEIKAGESIVDVERRMRAKGINIYRQGFLDMFRDEGAF